MTQITSKDAIRELWYRGVISWKLHHVQKEMLNSFITQNKEISVIVCNRKIGKSFFLCVLAIEQCLKKPHSIVKYVCPKKNMVKGILQPLMRQILIDCPPELKPEFKTNDYMYVFPNGSQIHMAGTDNGHHENIRGGISDLWIVDEAGFCSELKYVVNTILAPTADTTGGRGLLASTISKEPDHEFVTEFFKPAEMDGTLISFTIYDNPLYTPEKRQKIINRYPLKEKDPDFLREYMNKVSNSGDLAIIPEFTEEIQRKIIKEVERPPFFDSYVSMDIGFKDLTVVLFAYYDFEKATIVIEDEYVSNGTNLLLDRFAGEIIKKEQKLWTHPMSGKFKPPYVRVADNNNLILLNELTLKYNIPFLPTRKDNKEAALNTVRMKIANEQILIHPRCKTLIYHLANGSWNKNKKEFARSPDAGHYDAIDSLIYLVRNIHDYRNPYPPGYYTSTKDKFSPAPKKDYTPAQQTWVDMFKMRSSLKNK